jgi:HEAT repeat protein
MIGWIAILSVTVTAAVTPTPMPLRTPDPDHVAYWLNVLKTQPLKLMRKNAARNLGKMGTRDVVPNLIDALSDKEPTVRAEVARALGNLAD